MIVQKEVNIRIGNKEQIEHYSKLGYTPYWKKDITVKVEHLMMKSNIELDVVCDICGVGKKLIYSKYTKNTKNLTTSYCCSNKCAMFKQERTCSDRYGVKYDDFIFSSLNADFDENKKYVDERYPLQMLNSHWSITDMKYSSEFTLSKKNSDEYGDKVKINVTYSFDNEVWKLKSINLEIGYHSNIVLSVDKFSDIIFQYFIYLKFKEIQKLKQSKSETFQKMINVIGKDVKRDAIIDQILS